MCAYREERRGRQHRGALDHCRFTCARPRQHERAAVVSRGQDHRERAANRAQFTRQRKLTGEFVDVELVLRQLSARRENADGDRQVEAPRLLRQVGRRETHGDFSLWKLELRVLQRGANAVARLAHFGLRKPDDVDAGQPAREMDLDADAGCRHAGQRAAVDDGDGHGRRSMPASDPQTAERAPPVSHNEAKRCAPPSSVRMKQAMDSAEVR